MARPAHPELDSVDTPNRKVRWLSNNASQCGNGTSETKQRECQKVHVNCVHREPQPPWHPSLLHWPCLQLSDGWMGGSFVTCGKENVELGLWTGLLVKNRSQLHLLEVALK